MLSSKTLLAAVAVLSAALPATGALAAPINDHRPGAIVLAGAGDSHSGSTGSATSVVSDEPGKPGSGTHSVWYRWTAPKAGLVTFTTDASFDAVLTTYTGATTCCAWRSNDDDGAGDNPLVSFYVSAGQPYDIMVDGYTPGEHGFYEVSVAFDDTPPAPGNDAFATPEPLVSSGSTGAPMELQFATREWLSGEPDHRGLGGSHSLWFKWTAPDSGGVNLDVSCSTNAFTAHHPTVAAYRDGALATLDPVDATRAYDFDACSDDFLQFQAVEGETYRFAVDAAPDTALGGTYLHVDQDTEAPKIEFGGQKVYGPNSQIVYALSADEWRNTCKLDNGPEIACGSPFKLTKAADGDHTLAVRSTDHHGNTSAWSTFAFEVDGDAPETQVTAGPGPLTNETTSKIAFSSPDAGATFECREAASGPFKPCTSPYGTATRHHGQKGELEVRAVDKWGNRDASAATRTWLVDTRPPIVLHAGGYPVAPAGEPLTWAFRSDDPTATFECSLDQGPFAPCTPPYTAAGVGHATTRHLMVRATDPAGNTGVGSAHGKQTERVDPPQQGRATLPGGGTAAWPVADGGRGISVVRAPRSVSRRTLSRRGLAVAVGCASSCKAWLEVRSGARVLARGAGRGTVRATPLRGAATRIRRLRVGARLTVVVTVPGTPERRVTVRVGR